MNNLETHKVVFNNESQDSSLVFAISLVDDPANESMFMTFSKESPEVYKFSSEEKRLVTGVVLIPNQKILRFNKETNQEYNLIFEEDTIRKLSQKFFKNGYQSNSNINHDKKQVINNLTYVESWIIEDPENDKSNALGFGNLPKGTWMATAYVEDEDAWQKAKKGEVKGFSIECFLETEKIEMSVNINNNKINKKEKMSLLKRLITMFSADEAIKLSSIESDLGPLTVDSLELDAYVSQEVDGEMVPLKDSVFVYEGMVYRTDSEGKIVDIAEFVEELPAEGMADVAPVDGSVEEVIVAEVTPEVAEVIAEAVVDSGAVVEEIDWEAIVKNLTKKLEDVLKANKDLEVKVEEMSKQPASTKLKANENKGTGSKEESYFNTLSRIANSKQ